MISQNSTKLGFRKGLSAVCFQLKKCRWWVKRMKEAPIYKVKLLLASTHKQTNKQTRSISKEVNKYVFTLR